MSISEKALDDMCREIHDMYGISLAVCQIFGKRWSYIAGTGDNLYAGVRLLINEDYGLIADDIPEGVKKDVIERIRALFEGESL
jgi:hypothetical protein